MYDEDGALDALTAQGQLLKPEAPAKPGLFQGSWAAAAKAVPAAAVETMRMLNQVKRPPLPDEVRQGLDLSASVVEPAGARSTDDLNESASELNRQLGAAGRSLAPDPQASGKAAQLIHGITKGLTKIGMYGAVGGLPAIVGGFSVDEGVNESLRLQDDGVDPVTANKVGLVRGATAAIGAAIPGVGSTIMRTAGLVAAAGPATFWTDQSAIKHILDSANYHDKAAEYDPYDITGLLLASVPGAVVGGISMRGKIKANAAAAVEVARTAQAARELGAANDAAAVTAMADREAAARIMQTDTLLQRKALTPHDDLVGQIYHQNAVTTALRQLDDGAPIDVRGVPGRAASVEHVPLETLANSRMLDETGARLEAERTDLLPTAGNAAKLGDIAVLREQMTTLEQSRAALTDDAIKARAKEIQADDGLSYKQSLSQAKKELGTQGADLDARMRALEDQINTNRQASQAAQRLSAIDEQLRLVREERAGLDTPTPTRAALAVKQALSDFEMVRPESAKAGTKSVTAPLASDAAKATETATAKPSVLDEQKPTQVMPDDIPDTPIVIGHADDGTPITTTARALMDEARAQEAVAHTESKAFEAAIECFISTGGVL
ncbi:hypothetical protein [Herbaspirillum autotrophicum]|uniref:hypothetical protein n=1 Tax=Herbaspirillum autotrophicum TaxID=180195 RepID=UPI000AAA9180|nr:hypothetical protein [Herbaspirillum autotrophicum]